MVRINLLPWRPWRRTDEIGRFMVTSAMIFLGMTAVTCAGIILYSRFWL